MTIELGQTQIEEISDLAEKIGELESFINELIDLNYKADDDCYLKHAKCGTISLEFRIVYSALVTQHYEYIARMRDYKIVWKSDLKTVDAGLE